MKLFGKESENKSENKELSKFQEAWNNPRKKAAIKLGFWFVGMFFLILFLRVASPGIEYEREGSKSKDVVALSFEDKKENLRNSSNYEFLYNITIGEEKYNYKGSVVNSIEEGYKESSSGIIKYLIEDGIYYSVLNDKKEIYENLYENINTSLIDFQQIYLLLYPRGYEEIENEDYMVYKYNSFVINETDVYDIEVITDEFQIIKIGIKINEDYYELNYNNVIVEE